MLTTLLVSQGALPPTPPPISGFGGGYSPYNLWKERKKATRKKKRKAAAAAASYEEQPLAVPSAVSVVKAVDDARFEELSQELERLSLIAQMQLLDEARSELQARIEREANAAEALRLQQEVRAAIEDMIAERERLIAAEATQVEEIVDFLNDELWVALLVDEYATAPRKRRK